MVKRVIIEMQLFLNNGCLVCNENFKMKKLLLVTIVLLFGASVFGQSTDARLERKYGKASLDEMIAKNPKKYNMLLYALDNACYVTAKPSNKDLSLKSIACDPSQKLNFIDLGLDISNQNQYFLIDGTDKMLVVKSEWVLMNEMTTKK